MQVVHKKNRYFNAGLILFDTQKWNAQQITQKIRQFLIANPQVANQDQDALNAILNNRWQLLDPKYNVQSLITARGQLNPEPYLEALTKKARQNPTMIHFTSWSKPWVRFGKWVHPWRDQYFWYKYIAVQRLHDYAVKKRPLKKKIS